MGSLRIVTETTAANPIEGDLYLDDSGQLEWIGGDITDKEDYSRMVLQRIRCRLLFVKGEWYLDQRQGTPWREKIWKKGVNVETIKRIIRTVIEKTPGVERLDRLNVTFDSVSRTATITLTATSDLGTIVTTNILDNPFIIEVPQ